MTVVLSALPDALSALPGLATLVFAVSSMLQAGFSHTLADIAAPLRNARAVILALIANFALTPLLALAVARLLALDAPPAAGLTLCATAAGAPFLIRLTSAAGGDVGLSATLLVLLLPATVIYMPFAVPLLTPGAKVSPEQRRMTKAAGMGAGIDISFRYIYKIYYARTQHRLCDPRHSRSRRRPVGV